MSDDVARNITALDDVSLVTMLTRDAAQYTPEALAVAKAEAERRGVPIDEGFIPRDQAEELDEGGGFEAGGIAVACPHCKGESFQTREVLLNTRGLTFFNLDFLNRSATALICTNCGQVQLFAAPR